MTVKGTLTSGNIQKIPSDSDYEEIYKPGPKKVYTPAEVDGPLKKWMIRENEMYSTPRWVEKVKKPRRKRDIFED